MNFKHGFYSKNPDLNPDMILMRRHHGRNKGLSTLISLFDIERLSVGMLHSAFSSAMTQGNTDPEHTNSLSDWMVELCLDIEEEFGPETPQAKFGNMFLLLANAIKEFDICTSTLVRDMMIPAEQKTPFSQTRENLHLDSIVTKLSSLRAKI